MLIVRTDGIPRKSVSLLGHWKYPKNKTQRSQTKKQKITNGLTEGTILCRAILWNQ